MIPPTSARRFALAAFLVLGFGMGFGAKAPAALAGPGGAHPYFPDRGTLTWFEDLDSAQRAAISGATRPTVRNAALSATTRAGERLTTRRRATGSLALRER